jgi:hypothetical protein
MRGNVGGEYKEHKLNAEQKVSNNWIARATAGLFMVSGGKADHIVEISYNRMN